MLTADRARSHLAEIDAALDSLQGQLGPVPDAWRNSLTARRYALLALAAKCQRREATENGATVANGRTLAGGTKR